MLPKDKTRLIQIAKEFQNKDIMIALSNDPVLDRKVKRYHSDYPHLFVLSCIMDRQVSAETAWSIPYKICDLIGSMSIMDLNSLSEEEYIDLFKREIPHRYKSKMAGYFKRAIERIILVFDGDASIIWSNVPSSADVVSRFLEFEGCGVKIATMATNLLHRAFGVIYSDYNAIDVSPDVHVLRVMKRLGLISNIEKRELAIYAEHIGALRHPTGFAQQCAETA